MGKFHKQMSWGCKGLHPFFLYANLRKTQLSWNMVYEREQKLTDKFSEVSCLFPI